MIPRTTRSIGAFGEKKAAAYLMRHGYLIKERNWRTGKYEIDIIAVSLTDVVFAEVKTRTYRQKDLETAAPPKNAVHLAKQQYTRYAAQRYLQIHPTKKQPRMDVIEVWLDADAPRPKVLKIHHIKAAY